MKKTAKNGFLKSILVFTLIVSFSVLLLGGYWIFKGLAPRPLEVTNPKGEVLMTEASISGGQAVFQKYALMDYGTILGHGSYMGPDYTAEALKIYTEGMQNFKAVNDYGKSFNKLSDEEKSVVRDRVIREMRKNRYDSDSKTLELTQAQVYGLNKVRSHYRDVFTNGDGWGIEPGLIQERHMPDHDRAWVANEDQITQVSDFMFWTAWLASTLRPNDDITYTNNWPYDEEVAIRCHFPRFGGAEPASPSSFYLSVLFYFCFTAISLG